MKPRPYLVVLSLLAVVSCGDSEGPAKEPSATTPTTEEKTAPAGTPETTIVPGTKTEVPSGDSTTETITPPPAEGAAAGTPPATPSPAETSLLLEHPCKKQPMDCYPLRAIPGPSPVPEASRPKIVGPSATGEGSASHR